MTPILHSLTENPSKAKKELHRSPWVVIQDFIHPPLRQVRLASVSFDVVLPIDLYALHLLTYIGLYGGLGTFQV